MAGMTIAGLAREGGVGVGRTVPNPDSVRFTG
jgi:hypothetical protein